MTVSHPKRDMVQSDSWDMRILVTYLWSQWFWYHIHMRWRFGIAFALWFIWFYLSVIQNIIIFVITILFCWISLLPFVRCILIPYSIGVLACELEDGLRGCLCLFLLSLLVGIYLIWSVTVGNGTLFILEFVAVNLWPSNYRYKLDVTALLLFSKEKDRITNKTQR